MHSKAKEAVELFERRCGTASPEQAKPMASAAKTSTPWTGRSRSSQSSRDRSGRKKPPAQGSPPTLVLETPPFWRYPMTTRSTALCSSERILPFFRGSRLTPERSSKSSDLGARIHSVPRSRRRTAPKQKFKLKPEFRERGRHAGARGANAQIFKPFHQFCNSRLGCLACFEVRIVSSPQVRLLDKNRSRMRSGS